MHIKKVIIRGFKTYKDQVSLSEDFSKGVNVVVGFNGSGKSNFFNAILFVISEHYGTLRADVRKSLLHEGAGPPVLTAFVEIVFDNCDRRIPIDRDEVHVRRTIGAKKDDYSLDGKHATRAEVFNLLESCGFTKSNPYYIVQQGKVAELTLMSDVRRLELIKEISGAHVYEERRAESKQILDELETRRAKTDDIIATIAARIQSLEEEQRELVEYQALERRRRCLEFEITDREWRTAQDRIDALEPDRRDQTANLHEAQRLAAAARQKLNDADIEAQQMTTRHQQLSLERLEAERLRAGRMEDLARARLELEDEKKRAQTSQQSHEDMENEILRLRNEADDVNKAITELQPFIAKALERRGQLFQQKQVREAERDQLLAKQGRRTQYNSVAQRNKALADEVLRRKERRQRGAQQLASAEADLSRAQDAIEKIAQGKIARQQEMRALEHELSSEIGPGLARISQQLDEASEQRRLAAQDRERLTRQREEAERQVAVCQSRIEGTMPRPLRNALVEVKRWIEQQKINDSCFGTLLDNIAVPEVYGRAVENTAGNALFNLLVKDEHIAGRIVSLVRKGNLGNIVCTPLNQIVNRPRSYPKIQGVKPLVEVIKAPDIAVPAVHQVFGRVVVCQTLELCDEVSRKYGFDAITLEGDKVSSKGTLTGGYQDPTKFIRLSFAGRARQSRDIIDSLAPKLAACEKRAAEATAMLERLHNERKELQDARSQRRASLARATEAAQEADIQTARHVEAEARHRERQSDLRAQIAECDAALHVLEAELHTTTLGDLTPEEATRLQAACEQLRELETQLAASEEECHKLHREQVVREQHLKQFLLKRLRELQATILRERPEDREEQLRERQQVADRAERDHNEAAKRLDEFATELAELELAIDGLKMARDQLVAEDQNAQAKVALHTQALDELHAKALSIAKKRNDADEKLRSLIVVSTEMPKYKALSDEKLMDDLSKCQKSLRKFEHVNKKAIDQFATFTEQLKELERKRAEIGESRDAIRAFMQKIDEQKEDTLTQTLTTVGKHFSEVFAELVHKGVAKLRPLLAGDKVEGEEEAVAPVATSGTSVRGVRIDASFTGQETSFLTMSQLSGGQKTVVAISLVFAIQRLEPAPFYLFDEIDAALDTQYRTAIAKLIARDSQNAQMVITTFRPEIIETADKFYRVYMKNRCSQITCVQRNEARSVIEEQTRLERPGEE